MMLHRRATVGSSRRYSEALFFSEIIKRTGLTKTTQRSTGEEFFIINIPEIRRAAISFERIERKKERKKEKSANDGRGGSNWGNRGNYREKYIYKYNSSHLATSCKSSNESIQLQFEVKLYFSTITLPWRGYATIIALFFFLFCILPIDSF